MFIGHFAVGFAAKRVAPRLSLGTCFIACQLLDFIFPLLVLLKIEGIWVDHAASPVAPLGFHYPWSHSLALTVIWATLFAAGLLATKRGARNATVMAGVVVSHWVLDFISHRPDVPLWPSGPKVGLGLWNSVTATALVEVALFVAGAWLYVRARQRAGRAVGLAGWSLIAFFLLIYAMTLLAPKPPLDTSHVALAGPTLATWLFVAWAYWADRRPAR